MVVLEQVAGLHIAWILSSGPGLGREEVGVAAILTPGDMLLRIDAPADVTAPRWRQLQVGYETARPGGNGPASS